MAEARCSGVATYAVWLFCTPEVLNVLCVQHLGNEAASELYMQKISLPLHEATLRTSQGSSPYRLKPWP